MMVLFHLPACFIIDVTFQVCSHMIVLGTRVVRGGNKDYTTIQVVAIERITP